MYIYIYTIYYIRDGGESLLKGWLVEEGAEKVNKKRRPLLRKSMRPTFAGLPVNVMRNPHTRGQCFAEFGKYLCIAVGSGGVGRLTVMSKKLPQKNRNP